MPHPKKGLADMGVELVFYRHEGLDTTTHQNAKGVALAKKAELAPDDYQHVVDSWGGPKRPRVSGSASSGANSQSTGVKGEAPTSYQVKYTESLSKAKKMGTDVSNMLNEGKMLKASLEQRVAALQTKWEPAVIAAAYLHELTSKLPLLQEAHDKFLQGVASVAEATSDADCEGAIATFDRLKELGAHKMAFGTLFKPIAQFAKV